MRALKILIVSLFLMLAMATVASAGEGGTLTNEEQAQQLIDQGNAEIEAKIAQAEIDAIALAVQYTDAIELKEQTDILAAVLIDETNIISAYYRAEIAKLGFEAICEWIPVTLNGYVYMVDPIVIPGWGEKKT